MTAKIWLAILPSFLLTRRWFQQLNYLWVSAYEFCNIVSKNLTLFFLYLFAVWIKLLDLQLSDSNFRRTVSESLLIQFVQNWKCLRGFRKSFQRLILSGFLRVLENLESRGLLFWHFPVLESPGKRPQSLQYA